MNDKVDKYAAGVADYTGLDKDKIKETVPAENWKRTRDDFEKHPIKCYLNAIDRDAEIIEEHKQTIANFKDGKYDYKYTEEEIDRKIQKYKRYIKEHLRSLTHKWSLIYEELIKNAEVIITDDGKVEIEYDLSKIQLGDEE